MKTLPLGFDKRQHGELMSRLTNDVEYQQHYIRVSYSAYNVCLHYYRCIYCQWF